MSECITADVDVISRLLTSQEILAHMLDDILGRGTSVVAHGQGW